MMWITEDTWIVIGSTWTGRDLSAAGAHCESLKLVQSASSDLGLGGIRSVAQEQDSLPYPNKIVGCATDGIFAIAFHASMPSFCSP